MTRFSELLRVLASGSVNFLIIGGVAAAIHGSPRATLDLAICYSRQPANLERLVVALGPYHPYLRGAPAGLPFRFDVETLRAGMNFTLTTDLGWIDLFGEVVGGGRYEDLVAHAIVVEAYGFECRVLDIETLIRTKKLAGRPKDFQAIAELEILRRQKSSGQ